MTRAESVSTRARGRAAQPKPRRSAAPAARVLVVGMHRSGTSALTSLLDRMGLHAGAEDSFHPADQHNARGYWEHKQLYAIDEELLAELRGSWLDVLEVDPSRLSEASRSLFLARARALVVDLDRHGAWVLKDPRLCVLLPFWRQVLQDPVCVLIYRDPLAVARSLAGRDGLPLAVGLGLWEHHNLAALAGSEGLRRVLVSHRELLSDPAGTAARLRRDLRALRVPGLERLRALSREEASGLIDPLLEHNQVVAAEEQAEYLNQHQRALLAHLANGSALALRPVPALSRGARDALAAHSRQSREMVRLNAAAAEREAARAATEASRAELDRQLRQRDQELAAAGERLLAEREAAAQWQKEHSARLAALEEDAAERRKEHSARLAALEEDAAERRREQSARLAALEAAAAERHRDQLARLAELEGAVAAQREQVERVHGRLMEAERERAAIVAQLQAIADMSALLAQAEQRLAALTTELERADRATAERDQLLAAIFASRSWRLGFGVSRMVRLGLRTTPSALERWLELSRRG